MSRVKLFDIAGQKFGKLTAIELDHRDEAGRQHWKFKCECGQTVVKLRSRVENDGIKSCSRSCNLRIEDLTGKKFGRLTVRCLDHNEKIGPEGHASGSRNYWLCDCECGGTKITLSTFLKAGLTTTCGCGRMLDLEKGESGLKELYNGYKHTQKKKFNLDFPISKEEFKKLTSSNCHYCGIEPKYIMKSVSDYSAYYYNGLDRIDASKPYSLDNVVPCCGWCNRMKDEHSQKEFFDQILLLADRIRNGSILHIDRSEKLHAEGRHTAVDR
jgi:hypothetical protein